MAESGKGDLINIWEYLSILQSSWRILLLFSLAGFGAAFISSSMKDSIYESNTELVLEQHSANSIFTSSASGNSKVDDTFLLTQLRVLKSPYLTTRAVDLLLGSLEIAPSSSPVEGGLAVTDDPSLSEGIQAEWIDQDKLQEYVKDSSRERLASQVAGGVSVNFLPRTRILTIHAKSIDANFSAAAANAVAAAYGEYVSATYASSAQRGFLLLQKQAEEASQSIQKLASSVLEFRKKSEVQAMVGHSSGEDALAVSDQQVVMDRLALGDARVVSLTDELSQVNQSIKGLSHRYRPGHPEMKELKTQQAYLKSQIDTLRGRIYDQWKRTHLEQQNSVEFSMLEQELEAMRRFHELLLAKMREIDFSRDSPGASIRVLRSARAPSNHPIQTKPSILFLARSQALWQAY